MNFIRNIINRKRHYLLYSILFFVLSSSVFAQKVTAAVDVRSVTINDVISFTISAEGVSSNPSVDIAPLLKDFSVVSGPSQQSNMQFVNGKMTSSRKISWTLIANREGVIKIPSLPVKVGRKTYKTNELTIKVSKSQVSDDPDDLFILSEIDKNSVVIGEQVTVGYKLYTRVNVTISEITFPEYIGFWTEELYTPRQIDFRDTQIKGERYKVATLYKVALFPTKIGQISLPAMVINGNVEVKSNNRRRSVWDDPFFNSLDPFFNSRSTKPKVIRTEEEVIEVRPYESKAPSGYTNAVGQFVIRGIIDQNEVKANEAVTFRVELEGTGNLPILKIPDIEFPADLEVFPPTTEIERDPFRDEITGKISIEYILIPRKPGAYILPRIKFPFYNPSTRSWESTETQAVRLTVHPGQQTISTGPGFTKEEIVLLGKDIRYFRSEIPMWETSDAVTFNWKYFGIYIIIFGLYFLPGMVVNVQKQKTGSAQSRISKSALRHAIKSLKNPGEDVFEHSASSVYLYLKERFDLTSVNLDPLAVEKQFTSKIGHKTLLSLLEILKVCDAGRYAPGAIQRADTLLDETVNVLKEIDGQI